MNLYKSVQSQGGGSEIYIDGVKSSSSRIDVDSPKKTIPRNLMNSNKCAVVFNGEVYVNGFLNSSNPSVLCKWNGSSWSKVTDIPYKPLCMVVYDGCIHVMCSDEDVNDKTKHYKWDGSSWSTVSTLPAMSDASRPCAVVYNNRLYIIGVGTNSNKVYVFNGTSWTEHSTLGIGFIGKACVHDNKIYGVGMSTSYDSYQIIYNGSSWEQQEISVGGYYLGALVSYNDVLYNFFSTSYQIYNGSTWIAGGTTNNSATYICVIVYNNKLLHLGSLQNGNEFIEEIGKTYGQYTLA